MSVKVAPVIHIVNTPEDQSAICGQPVNGNYVLELLDSATCPFCRDMSKLKPRQPPAQHQTGELISDERLAVLLNEAGAVVVWHREPSWSPQRKGIYLRINDLHVFTGWAMIDGKWMHVNERVLG